LVTRGGGGQSREVEKRVYWLRKHQISFSTSTSVKGGKSSTDGWNKKEKGEKNSTLRSRKEEGITSVKKVRGLYLHVRDGRRKSLRGTKREKRGKKPIFGTKARGEEGESASSQRLTSMFSLFA